MNLVWSLKSCSTLFVYSCLSRMTVPLPLSGLVIVMELSDLSCLSACICEGGRWGMVCLCLLNSRKEVWAVLEICCDNSVQFRLLSLEMGLGLRPCRSFSKLRKWSIKLILCLGRAKFGPRARIAFSSGESFLLDWLITTLLMSTLKSGEIPRKESFLWWVFSMFRHLLLLVWQRRLYRIVKSNRETLALKSVYALSSLDLFVLSCLCLVCIS